MGGLDHSVLYGKTILGLSSHDHRHGVTDHEHHEDLHHRHQSPQAHHQDAHQRRLGETESRSLAMMLSKSSFEFSCIVARLLGMIKCKIAIEQSKEIFPPVSFHHLWNFLLAKNKLPPPSSLSPSLSMVYWSICILGGSIVLVRKSIVLVERDCANAIVQYSIIVKLSIIVSDHCNC